MNIYKSFGIYRITNLLNGKSYIGKPNGATLTIDTVHEIRRLHEQEKKTITEISNLLGIPRPNIYNISTYRRWANA